MPEPLLEIRGLDAHYGSAHILLDLDCVVGSGTTGIIGRNGMGKSTLCNVVAGLPPARATGSVRLDGQEILGRSSHDICRRGLAIVPQGRRIFGSLTTEEHLRMIARSLTSRGPWSVDTVYDLYPRLAQRRRVRAGQLSGGEQQMLAIGRALLTNPTLLVLDEPSEGLAPAIVAQLTETCRKLAREGVALLLVEQNLGMATAVADRLLVLVGGELALDTTSREFLADDATQRRLLGVQTGVPHDRPEGA